MAVLQILSCEEKTPASFQASKLSTFLNNVVKSLDNSINNKAYIFTLFACYMYGIGQRHNLNNMLKDRTPTIIEAASNSLYIDGKFRSPTRPVVTKALDAVKATLASLQPQGREAPPSASAPGAPFAIPAAAVAAANIVAVPAPDFASSAAPVVAANLVAVPAPDLAASAAPVAAAVPVANVAPVAVSKAAAAAAAAALNVIAPSSSAPLIDFGSSAAPVVAANLVAVPAPDLAASAAPVAAAVPVANVAPVAESKAVAAAAAAFLNVIAPSSSAPLIDPATVSRAPSGNPLASQAAPSKSNADLEEEEVKGPIRKKARIDGIQLNTSIKVVQPANYVFRFQVPATFCSKPVEAADVHVLAARG